MQELNIFRVIFQIAILGDDGVGEGGDDVGFGAERAGDLGGEAEVGEDDGGVEFVGVAEV